MVSYTVLALVVLGTLVTVGTVTAGAWWLGGLVRRLQSETHGHHHAHKGGVPSPLDDSSLRILSERLSIIEGRIPALQQTMDGYGAISTRLSALEANLPAVVEAYDKFSQVSLNADKRMAERERRAGKKKDAEDSEGLTVAQAADQMGLAANAEPAQAAAAPSNGKPPGVYGRKT